MKEQEQPNPIHPHCRQARVDLPRMKLTIDGKGLPETSQEREAQLKEKGIFGFYKSIIKDEAMVLFFGLNTHQAGLMAYSVPVCAALYTVLGEPENEKLFKNIFEGRQWHENTIDTDPNGGPSYIFTHTQGVRQGDTVQTLYTISYTIKRVGTEIIIGKPEILFDKMLKGVQEELTQALPGFSEQTYQLSETIKLGEGSKGELGKLDNDYYHEVYKRIFEAKSPKLIAEPAIEEKVVPNNLRSTKFDTWVEAKLASIEREVGSQYRNEPGRPHLTMSRPPQQVSEELWKVAGLESLKPGWKLKPVEVIDFTAARQALGKLEKHYAEYKGEHKEMDAGHRATLANLKLQYLLILQRLAVSYNGASSATIKEMVKQVFIKAEKSTIITTHPKGNPLTKFFISTFGVKTEAQKQVSALKQSVLELKTQEEQRKMEEKKKAKQDQRTTPIRFTLV